jgi:predicted enzyme related to lactoylglutathione lyase
MRIPLGDGVQEVVLSFPDSKGAGVILMWHENKQAPRSHGDGYSRFVLNVSNVDAALAHVIKHGAPVVTAATTIGPMKYAMVKDPDGYIIELLEFLKS